MNTACITRTHEPPRKKSSNKGINVYTSKAILFSISQQTGKTPHNRIIQSYSTSTAPTTKTAKTSKEDRLAGPSVKGARFAFNCLNKE